MRQQGDISPLACQGRKYFTATSMAADAMTEEGFAEVVERCPVCGSDRSKFFATGRDRQLKASEETFSVFRCKTCGSLYLKERVQERSISHYYNTKFYPPYEMTKAAAHPDTLSTLRFTKLVRLASRSKLLKALAYRFDALVEFVFGRGIRKREQEIAEVYGEADAQNVFIDYGCGTERMLHSMVAKGWRSIGVDFSEKVIAKLREKGHEAYLGLVELDSAVADDSVDLIRLSHVIEHLYNPEETLKVLYRKLRKGGVLHIITPNADSIGSRVFRTYWFALDVPRHIQIFSVKGLRRCIRKAGYKELKVIHEAPVKVLIKSIAYLEEEVGRLSGVHPDLILYDNLYSRALVVPVHLFARLGFSESIHLLAEK